MGSDNNEPFQVIYRIGCLRAFPAQGSQCSSGVYYGGRMPNPAYILANGVHCSTLQMETLFWLSIIWGESKNSFWVLFSTSYNSKVMGNTARMRGIIYSRGDIYSFLI